MKINLTKKFNIILTSVILGVALIITIITGITFKSFSDYQTYFYIRNEVEIEHLSKYIPSIEGTVGDTEIYILKGEEVTPETDIRKCPSVLVLGGTHPNEPSGQLTATLLLENIKVSGNTVVFIITETNKSAYTHSHPQEATSLYYTLKTQSGKERTFKFGSRATNTNQQWPNPDIYTHIDPNTGAIQQLSTNDTRNLNRAYPGNKNGTYTEKIAYGIVELIKQNDIKVTIDLHEASPEYQTINTIIHHPKAGSVASNAKTTYLESVDGLEDFTITIERAPENLRGLTHIELGDYTDTLSFLCETSNAAQGKIRGAFTPDLITYYKTDKFYEAAAKLDETLLKEGKQTLLYARPVSIDERVARHLASIEAIIHAYNYEAGRKKTGFLSLGEERKQFLHECGKFEIDFGLADMLQGENKTKYGSDESCYQMVLNLGVGYFLHDEEN